VAIVGGIGGGIANLYPLGVSSVFSLVSGPMTLEEALAQAEPLLADAAERVLRLVLAYSRPPSRPRR
jgi:glycerate kinase